MTFGSTGPLNLTTSAATSSFSSASFLSFAPFPRFPFLSGDDLVGDGSFSSFSVVLMMSYSSMLKSLSSYGS
jgi:hypothetical protein